MVHGTACMNQTFLKADYAQLSDTIKSESLGPSYDVFRLFVEGLRGMLRCMLCCRDSAIVKVATRIHISEYR